MVSSHERCLIRYVLGICIRDPPAFFGEGSSSRDVLELGGDVLLLVFCLLPKGKIPLIRVILETLTCSEFKLFATS